MNRLQRICSSNFLKSKRQFSSRFDQNSALVKVRQYDNKGHFTAQLTDQLSVANVPNGGLLMAIAISAAKEMITFPEPLTVTGHYVNKALENKQAEIIVEILNVSKSTATVEMKILQEDILRCTFLGTFGNIAAMRGLQYSDMTAPVLPPVEECVDVGSLLTKGLGLNVTLFNTVSLRIPKDSSFLTDLVHGRVAKKPSYECWSRFSELDRKPCTRSLAFFLDAIPPPVLLIAPTTWVPTLEYTVHFWNAPNPCPCKRNLPLPIESDSAGVIPKHHAAHAHIHTHNSDAKLGSDWLRLRLTTPFIRNGLLCADAEAWSEDGKVLLATAKQMARVLQPGGSKSHK